jgi:hypothetical protein
MIVCFIFASTKSGLFIDEHWVSKLWKDMKWGMDLILELAQ